MLPYLQEGGSFSREHLQMWVCYCNQRNATAWLWISGVDECHLSAVPNYPAPFASLRLKSLQLEEFGGH